VRREGDHGAAQGASRHPDARRGGRWARAAASRRQNAGQGGRRAVGKLERRVEGEDELQEGDGNGYRGGVAGHRFQQKSTTRKNPGDGIDPHPGAWAAVAGIEQRQWAVGGYLRKKTTIDFFFQDTVTRILIRLMRKKIKRGRRWEDKEKIFFLFYNFFKEFCRYFWITILSDEYNWSTRYTATHFSLMI
jgi:hypothetical protein